MLNNEIWYLRQHLIHSVELYENFHKCLFLQPSYDKKKINFHGQAAMLGHNLAINRHITEILVSFDRVDQELSNDTNSWDLTITMGSYGQKSEKIPENGK